MAKTEKTYVASLSCEDKVVLGEVNLFDLPRENNGSAYTITIADSVDLGRSKNRAWPNLASVRILGDFDCSDFTISSDTVLPAYFERLICKHSINDLGPLMGRLPTGFLSSKSPTIIVRTALLNNIRKNKDGALAVARQFMSMYPNVSVSDGKQTLREICAQIDAQTPAPAVAAPVVTAPVDTPSNIKTDEWMSADEVVAYCTSYSSEIAKLPVEQILRLIKMARSARANLKLRTEQFTRPEDGAVITCIHRDDVSRVAEYVMDGAMARDARDDARDNSAPKRAAKKTPAPDTSKTPASTSGRQRYYFGNREIVRTKIKKYIARSAWCRIMSKVGHSTQDALNVLQDIENINVNPTQTPGSQVVFIQDGQVRVSPTVKFKNSRCLCQGFGTLDDRPRIVWGISGNTFVCQRFFEEHDTCDKKYNNYLRDIDIDASKLDLSEYIYVPDLIEQLSNMRQTPAQEPQTVEPMVEPVAAPVVEPVVEQVAEPVAEPVVEPAAELVSVNNDVAPVEKAPRRGRPRKVDTRVPAQTSAPNKVADITVPYNSNPTEPIVPNTASENVEWTEICTVNNRYSERLRILNDSQKIILEQMIGETDTVAMLRMTNNLKYVLEQKQECERAMRKIRLMNEALQRLQNKLNTLGK